MKFKKQLNGGRYDVYNDDNVKVGEVWKIYKYGFNYWKNDKNPNCRGIDSYMYSTRKEASEYLIKNHKEC